MFALRSRDERLRPLERGLPSSAIDGATASPQEVTLTDPPRTSYSGEDQGCTILPFNTHFMIVFNPLYPLIEPRKVDFINIACWI